MGRKYNSCNFFLQNGVGCRCGYYPFYAISSDYCNKPCRGDPSTTCGGWSHNEVYQLQRHYLEHGYAESEAFCL